MKYSNIPHISTFHLRPKNVSYNTKLSGNEGQCFCYTKVNSISYVLIMFDYTRQIKCDKTGTKIFGLDKVLFHISVPFSLQSDDI